MNMIGLGSFTEDLAYEGDIGTRVFGITMCLLAGIGYGIEGIVFRGVGDMVDNTAMTHYFNVINCLFLSSLGNYNT